MEQIILLELSLQIETIIVGEQFKGGTFRPCQETIPASTIEGALYYHFGVHIPAVGFFEAGTYAIREFTYSVRDKSLDSSKLPITTNYLAPAKKNGSEYIRAKVYLPYHVAQPYQESLSKAEFRMGALKNKGFGKCWVTAVEKKDVEIVQGFLNVKLFEEECTEFGITPIAPKYGYLFRLSEEPKNPVKGMYKRALFVGSVVKAPKVLLEKEEVTYYDE
jgi:hypothetical protein